LENDAEIRGNWIEKFTTIQKGHLPEFKSWQDLDLSEASKKFLKTLPKGIYLHQYEALQNIQKGKNVCISTRTASGKSLVFYVSAMEMLSKNPNAKILAVYPLKALGREQEERWKAAFEQAGLEYRVGRIDGQIPTEQRPQIVQNSKILIMTPDVIHAWLLSNLSNKRVCDFISNLSLMVVDEVHSYNGVFGSNSAFLFRRLALLAKLLGASVQFICASATIANPVKHVVDLFGLDFVHIGQEYDTSPRFDIKISLLEPPPTSDLLSEIAHLLSRLVQNGKSRFICFVDSRKQTEFISSILARHSRREEFEYDGEEFEKLKQNVDHLEKLDVLPYRAGYEEYDRQKIQDRLSTGSLRGVISTSALELGIDIPHLDVAVLVGVPRSATSFQQRIGRVGRKQKGFIFVLNTGDVYDETLFNKPEKILDRPLAESALYLENQRIQYIHALCLGRENGEIDQVFKSGEVQVEQDISKILALVDWPRGFRELVEKERIGELPIDLQPMKLEAGEDPNHYFPLRDVEPQFRILLKTWNMLENLGSVSHSQMMREAYPGAIYYYTTKPYRVYQIINRSKEILVRQEKRYTTKPVSLPTLVYPNLSESNVYKALQFENCIGIECNLQIKEIVKGFEERRGPNKAHYDYPMDYAETGIRFQLPMFSRHFFTTGVVLHHPELRRGVEVEKIASILFEAFLMVVPFERRDLSVSSDKFRATRGSIEEGARFIAIFDQTYGSLRLSGRLLERNVLKRTLETALEMIENGVVPPLTEDSQKCVHEMLNSVSTEPVPLDFLESQEPPETNQPNLVKIILL